MFDPVYSRVMQSLRSDPRIVFDGSSIDSGVTYTVRFDIEQIHQDNKITVHLQEIFADFPEGFSVLAVSSFEHTASKTPEPYDNKCYSGTMDLRVMKTNEHRGQDGVAETLADEDNLDDVLKHYRNLSATKQKLFIKFARTFLKGLAV